MLIVLPVSRADSALAVRLSELLKKFGSLRPHKLLLAFCKSCPPSDQLQISANCSGLGEVITVKLETRDERGWPLSCNSVFHEVAQTVWKNNGYGERSWYFFEADNVPLVADWAHRIADEYVYANRPYMGVKNITKMTRNLPDGEIEEIQEGYHMVGTGVYPWDAYQFCRLMRHIPMLTHPFDVIIQYEVVPLMADTTLIQHNWGTHKYRVDDSTGKSQVVCETAKGFPEYAKNVLRGTVVVHGCKDTSLLDLILADTEE